MIDPVLDCDPHASTTSTVSVGHVEALLARERLNVHFVLETHAMPTTRTDVR